MPNDIEERVVAEYIQRIQVSAKGEQTNVYFQDGSTLVLDYNGGLMFLSLLGDMSLVSWIIVDKPDGTTEWLRRGYLQRVQSLKTGQVTVFMQAGPPIQFTGEAAAEFMQKLLRKGEPE